MSSFWKTALQNPKTSLSGMLSFLMVTGAYLAGYAVVHQTPFWVKVGSVSSFVSGLAKVYIALASKDAGKQQAYVPGEGVQSVPSHEMPNNPADQVITKN